jgi:hypothetical protein
MKVIEKNRAEFERLGVKVSSIRSHSARKGATTLAASGCTVSPSMASICNHAGWKLGGTRDKYMKYKAAGGHKCQRILSFPECLCTLLLFIGIVEVLIHIVLHFILQEGMISQKKSMIQRLSQMRRLIKFVTKAAQKESFYIQASWIQTKVQATQLYEATKHNFEHPGIYEKIRRHESISWKAYHNIMTKGKWKLVGEA